MSGFYRMGDPGEDTVAHINTDRRNSGAKCRMPRFEKDDPQWGDLCGRMSVALCDAPLQPQPTSMMQYTTCDKPICELHRIKHVTKPNTDFCPDHKELAEGR